jgi:hypothetical protein
LFLNAVEPFLLKMFFFLFDNVEAKASFPLAWLTVLPSSEMPVTSANGAITLAPWADNEQK